MQLTATSCWLSDKQLQKAYENICHKRIDAHSNNDIWDLRHNWAREKSIILDNITTNRYEFDAVKQVESNGELVEVWSARDTVVIKALETVLKRLITGEISEACTHIKGHGGLKGAVNKGNMTLVQYKYVCRTDVKKYYASIRHDILFDVIKKFCRESHLLSLVYKLIKRVTYRNGFYHEDTRGIGRGCALSPLFGALYLEELESYGQNERVLHTLHG